MKFGQEILQKNLRSDKTMNKIKVVWVCSFSNPSTRRRLPIKISLWKRILFRLKGKKLVLSDTAIWNSNAIKEMEKINDVDLHVICPVRGLGKKEVRYEENNIHYYFFREQNSNTIRFILHQLFTKYTSLYKKNRRHIKTLIAEIRPAIVHVMGAENPYYSLAALDVPADIICIVQLQALLTRLVNVTQIAEESRNFYYKGLFERQIINRADYIGTNVDDFKSYILQEIKPNAKFLEISLAMAQEINLAPEKKQFDFVYFAANISKAGEDALEAFILASKRNPNMTLDVVGAYDDLYKEKLDKRIAECGIVDAVTFEGRLPSHDDVIRQIRKSRFALLPLKMDFVPNTLREAMANGLPVITTITDGTPKLNMDSYCVMLSKQGDYQSMADNMLKLLSDDNLAKELVKNAARYEEGRHSNAKILQKWREAYQKVLQYSNRI